MGKRRSGVALAYVLLMTVVLFAFIAAFFLRFTHTLKFLSYDEGGVRARALAESGAYLAVTLLRERAVDWYEAFDQPIPSSVFGPEYTEEVLGGQFELEFTREPDLYPGAGEWLTLVSTGRSGKRTARTAVTLKLTNPVINYAILNNAGTYRVTWGSITGPIFSNGDVWIRHDAWGYNDFHQRWIHSWSHPKLDAEIKATGDIFLQNENGDSTMSPRYSAAKKYFDGSYSPEVIVHDDLPHVDEKGSLTLTGDLEAQPNVAVGVDTPEMSEVLAKYRQKEDKTVVDVSDYPEGVMAEFIDGKLYLSRARYQTVGKVFDKDIYAEQAPHLIRDLESNYGVSGVDQLLRNEVVWNDPDFPDAPYPSELQDDLNGDGVPETAGDYIELKKLVRGEPLPGSPIHLSRSEYKTVYLETSRTDHDLDGDGKANAPPIFVRGNVEGKAVMVYDVTDDALDPNYDKLNMFVLGQHEDPYRDENTHQVTISHPGVPGGLRYEDPTSKSSPDSTEPASPDALIMVSRGNLNSFGETGWYKDVVRAEDGTAVRFLDQLRSLDKLYVDHFTAQGDWEAGDYRMYRGGAQVTTPMFGVFLANRSRADTPRLSTEGQLVEGYGDRAHRTWMKWESFPAPWPDGARPNRYALFPLRMRQSRTSEGATYDVNGALASLGKPLYNRGDVRYDYKMQSLTAAELEEIGLPLSVVVATWQTL